MCMNTTVFGDAPAVGEDSFWLAKASPRIIGAGGEVAEHELVALLGDGGRAGDVDDQRNALLLGDLGDGGGLAGIEGADEKLRALADQLLGAGAGGVDVGFGVAIHDAEFRETHRFEDCRGDVDAALAVLADASLQARTRQQDADLERAARRAHDVERRTAGEETCGAEAGGEGAARWPRGIRLRFACHDEILPTFMLSGIHPMMPDECERSQVRKCRGAAAPLSAE